MHIPTYILKPARSFGEENNHLKLHPSHAHSLTRTRTSGKIENGPEIQQLFPTWQINTSGPFNFLP